MTKRSNLKRAGLIAAVMTVAGLSIGAAAMEAATPALLPSIDLTLTPRPLPGKSGEIETLDVTLQFRGVNAAADAPLLRLPLIASNVDTVATTLMKLEARDDIGMLALRAHDVVLPAENARDAFTGGPSREWRASRATRGQISISYSVAAKATLPPRGPAPPFSFVNDDRGASAAGQIFLLLPPGDVHYRTAIKWNLDALPAGSRGISSLGEGDVVAPEAMSGGELRMSFFIAGNIRTYPDQPPRTGFFSAWQGKAPFNASKLMAWTGSLYGDYAKFFGQKQAQPYGVFLRYNPINAGGGVGLYHSFVATYGDPGKQGSDVEKLKVTLAHEMFHTFQPFIEDPGGLQSSWFGEGLAVFYAARLATRFHLLSPEGFLADLNFGAGRYYTSAMATLPNKDVADRFWSDTRVRTLPYDRGMLYFATVDEAVRKKTDGAQSLDDLMVEMLALGQSGVRTSDRDWEAILERHLGRGAVEAFRQFIAGRMPIPSSEAFGPCFRRTIRALRQYDLGFDPAVLAEAKRVVRGLVQGSAAARAGLRDGDEIVRPVPQDGIQGEQDSQLSLLIRRDGQEFPITYLPRGKTVDAYQWERVADVPADSCKL